MGVKWRDRLLDAAANGLEVWMSYAAVEYLFSTAIPLLVHREKVLGETQWRGTVVLFVSYAVWGLVMGLFTGVSIAGAQQLTMEEFNRRNRKLLALLMVATFAANLVLLADQPGRVAALLGIVLVTGAVICNFGATSSSLGLSDFPAAVSVILILPARLAFVNWKGHSEILRVPLTLLATFACLIVATLVIRLPFKIRSKRFWSPALEHFVTAATVVGMIFGPGAVSSIKGQIGGSSSLPTSGRALPNIILITMDTVRADHMGIYGYSRQNTPNLKELLKESSLYTNLTAASSITLTSHASIFSGLYPRSHGAYKQFPGFPLGHPFAEGIPTIATILDSAGYRTIALSANLGFLGPEWGLVRGFGYSWTPRPIPLIESNHKYLLRTLIGKMLHGQHVVNDLYASPPVQADVITHRAISLLNQLTSGQRTPFFLFLNYMDAHWPYRPPAPFDTMYPGRSDRLGVMDEEADGALRNHVDCDGGPIPSGYLAHSVSQYDGAIAFMDSKIGELVQYLKANGLFDDTMIIITADHGEALGDHGSLGHNVSVYQDQIHVPLIVKYPGQPGGSRFDNRVSHVDFLPTILDVVGLARRPDLPGVSLLRLNSSTDRVIVSERHFGPCQDSGGTIPEVQYALFRGSSKIISSSLGIREEYDLAADPNEKVDLYSIAPRLALESVLLDWIRSTPRFREAAQPLNSKQIKRDSEQMRRLRSLGYLQ
jgi:arylsulfatase A-like enzyme